MANIKSSGGGDPTKAVMEGLRAQKKQLTMDFMDLWYQETTDWLTEAAERRSQLGVSHGREGRAQNGLDAIRDKSLPPTWDDAAEQWSFSFPHEGAVFQEFGARPHEIRAKKAQVLAFEWPDAPAEVEEQFEDTEGDLVFFESIDHPGIPAIGFVRYGRDQAKRLLESRGYNVEEFSG